MSAELTVQSQMLSAKAEALIASGDLTELSAVERVTWYKMRCDAAGLDWRTQPFQYLKLNGKTVLYATKTASEQAAETRGVSLEILSRDRMDGLFVVTCRAKDKSGRGTDSIGAVAIENLRGEALANALMKAETKAKRRAVLSFCGLGMLDETEIDSVPGAAVLPIEDAHASAPMPTEPPNLRFSHINQESEQAQQQEEPPKEVVNLRRILSRVYKKAGLELPDQWPEADEATLCDMIYFGITGEEQGHPKYNTSEIKYKAKTYLEPDPISTGEKKRQERAAEAAALYEAHMGEEGALEGEVVE